MGIRVSDAIMTFYPKAIFQMSTDDDYEHLTWISTDIPKPSKEELLQKVEQLKAEAQKAVDLGFMESNPLASFDAGVMSADNYAKIDLHKNYVDNITLVSPTGKPMKR